MSELLLTTLLILSAPDSGVMPSSLPVTGAASTSGGEVKTTPSPLKSGVAETREGLERDVGGTFHAMLDWLLVHGVKLAMIVAGMVALNWMGGLVLRRFAGTMTRTGVGEEEVDRDARTEVIASYLQPVLTALIVLVGGMMLLDEIQVPTAPILAMGSALFAMIAVGFFASWSVLSNAFCSVILLVYQPFTVGHTIELHDAEVRGKVVNFNLLYTTLESAEGELIHVPNNLFFQQPVRKLAGGSGASLDQQLMEKPEEASEKGV